MAKFAWKTFIGGFLRGTVGLDLMKSEEADKVYRFLGYKDMVQYHTREGGHDIVAYDWNYYLDFADQKLSHSVK